MSYSSTVLADSPVAYWRLSETTGTNAVNAANAGTNDMTYVASPTLNQTGAYAGSTSVRFTRSSSQYASVTHTSALNLGDGPLSFECWYKAASAVMGSTNQWTMSQGAGTVHMKLDNAAGAVWAAVPGVDYGAYSSVSVDDFNWHHIVITKIVASELYKVYVDGVDRTTLYGSGAYAVSGTVTYIAYGGDVAQYADGWMQDVAVYGAALSPTQVAAHYAAAFGPAWTTPADTVSMSTTPDLKFTSPTSAAKQHFQMQLDTVNTFDSGNLRTYDSSSSQANWTYWDGSAWQALPGDGLPIAKSGNEVDYTVTSALSATTWYRRVRAGSA